MIVFAVYNIKGGVGKTAAAVNLAWLSAREGARTLLWDLDPQGASSFTFRIKPGVEGGGQGLMKHKDSVLQSIKGTDYDRLDVLPADFSYRNLDIDLDHSAKRVRGLEKVLAPLEDEYDHVFIDCAPGISLVSENVFAAADVLLVPTIPTVLSLRTLGRLLKHLKQAKRRPARVLPFFCMVDRRKALHRKVCAWALEHSKGFLDTTIPYASLVEQMGVRRKPVTAFAPSSAAARAFAGLWAEVHAGLSDAGEVAAPSRRTVRQLLRDLQPPEEGVLHAPETPKPSKARKRRPAASAPPEPAPETEPEEQATPPAAPPADAPTADEAPTAPPAPVPAAAAPEDAPNGHAPEADDDGAEPVDMDIDGLELEPEDGREAERVAAARAGRPVVFEVEPVEEPVTDDRAPAARGQPADDPPEPPREVEFKLRLSGEADLTALADHLDGLHDALAAKAALQVNHFFDTSDWALRGHGCTLRLREEEGRFVVTAKGPGERAADGALTVRPEEEVQVDASRARQILSGRLSPLEALRARHGGEDTTLSARVAATVGDRALAHVGTFRNERRRTPPLVLDGPDGPLELSLEIDRTEFPLGRVDHELEVEVPAQLAPAAEAALRSLFGRASLPWRSAPSKAARFFGTLARETA